MNGSDGIDEWQKTSSEFVYILPLFTALFAIDSGRRKCVIWERIEFYCK